MYGDGKQAMADLSETAAAILAVLGKMDTLELEKLVH